MHALLLAGAFVASHWQAISAAIVGFASFIGTLKNLFSKSPKVETVLDKTLDVLALVSKYGAVGVPYLGRISVPGLPSRPVAAPKPDLKVLP